MVVNTSIRIAGVEFVNPVIAASGTYGFGREYADYVDLNNLGGISVKGLTLKPRMGNKTPRIAETPSGILNSVGLQNPGMDAFISKEIPYLKQYSTKIIANIAGNTLEDYIEMAEKLNGTGTDMVEVNVSCPNVKRGGIAFGTTPESVGEVTKAVREVTDIPIIVKLTPNVSDIASIAMMAEEAGADAISLINTIIGMVIDVNTRRPVLANNTGGLSGPAVRPVAVRMVHEVYKAVSIPIIGMGGICTGEDAIQFILAGASAVMVGTWNFNNPYACTDVASGIESYMVRNGITNLKEITGALILNGE
ncbi:MAG: dihydroorotate dehydrogenase [Clostridiales bacterium]|nr:dihydroorotate dehydrogenase [Clostridiales bacterium]